MKISYVMIVLNGMPFIEFSLRSIYDFAHEIVVVEGAVESCMFAANSNGSSKDGTVEFVKAFPDPENKIKLIQGRWPEKREMQNEALKHISGDYIWLIDSDEVYKKEDINTVIGILEESPTITEVHFPIFHFWKGFDYIISSKILESCFFHRIFKLSKPCNFTTHRPPTLLWKQQNKTTDKMNLLEASILKGKGVCVYHYSYILEEQVEQKIKLYKEYGWEKYWSIDLDDWYNNCFLKWTPENRNIIDKKYAIWTGSINSCTVPFKGSHPDVILDYIRKFKESTS